MTSSMRKLRFSSCPGAKVRHQGPPDIDRGQPWGGGGGGGGEGNALTKDHDKSSETQGSQSVA